jgi:hypothetical protein
MCRKCLEASGKSADRGFGLPTVRQPSDFQPEPLHIDVGYELLQTQNVFRGYTRIGTHIKIG